jgi:hypothetical protein
MWRLMPSTRPQVTSDDVPWWGVGLPLHGTTAYQETLCHTIAENRRDDMGAMATLRRYVLQGITAKRCHIPIRERIEQKRSRMAITQQHTPK